MTRLNFFRDIVSPEPEKNGSQSLSLYYLEGIVRFPSLSGPYGKGPLPKGRYKLGPLIDINPEICTPGFRVGKIAFWIKLYPQFETNRIGLGIHPDGNIKGTLGCIGIHPDYAEIFYHLWKHLERMNELPEYLDVF